MKKVYLLQHVHELGDAAEDVKVIGVYSSRESADAAVRRLTKQPGFSSFPSSFVVEEYEVDQDHWLEGFVTVE